MAAPLPVGRTAPETAAALALLDPVLFLGRDEPVRDGRTLDGPGVVVLTSGTTAAPKGVVLSVDALDASAAAWLAALPPASGWLLALGLAHVAGIGVLWRAASGRVPMRIVPPDDAAAQLEALTDDPAMSHVSLVPAQLARLLDAAAAVAPPPSLRAVLLGGGTIPAALVTRALDAGWPVVPTYGLSEAGSGVTALATADAREAPGSAGRPLPGVTVTIEDPGADGVGEIVVDTPARFQGYLGEPPHDGPIRTGDLGSLDGEGRLTVVDRRADLIVRGGENIAPAEVEAALLAQPAIADAAVVARRDEAFGQVPVAAIVLRADVPDPGDEAILRACRSSLAGFKVPAAIVRLDALPRTPGGKLRREAVRALLDDGPAGILARPDGDAIGWRRTGDGGTPLVLLPGTLSTAGQLDRLAAELARPGDLEVHALDRRGSGTSVLADPRPLDVSVQVADLVAYLDARGLDAPIVVGISFGAVLGLETAARHPGRVRALVAWEPPYIPLADADTRARIGGQAGSLAAAYAEGGPPAVTDRFMRAVGGDARWEGLPAGARAWLGREGTSALADAGLLGLEPDGLGRITAPTTILVGTEGDPWAPAVAEALAARIRDARRATIDGFAHPSPIIDVVPFAQSVRAALAAAGVLEPDPSGDRRPAVTIPEARP